MDNGIFSFIKGETPTGRIARISKAIKERAGTGTAEVGIWFYFRGELITETLPWQEAHKVLDWYESPYLHIKLWQTLSKRDPTMRGIPYEAVERGRVIYRIKPSNQFEVLLSPKSFKDKSLKDMLIREFSLPKGNTKFISDKHYVTEDVLDLYEGDDDGGEDISKYF